MSLTRLPGDQKMNVLYQENTEGKHDLSPDIRVLIERIPLFHVSETVRVEPLSGGASLNNANYCLTWHDQKYVLRVALEAARFLGVRREEELEAAHAAATIGLAPEILYSEPAGHLLMPWINGRHWEREEFHEPHNLQRLAAALKQLHSLNHLRGDGSVYRRIERLLESAVSLQQELPENIAQFRVRMADIEARRRADPRFTPGLVHNDFWANNFLDDGERLWIVDWEFGGHGDGFYDLATTVLAGGYSEDEQLLFLEAYGCTHSEDRQALEAMKFIVSFFEGAWALVLHGLRGSSDYDYFSHSRRMFDRMVSQV